MTMGFETLPRNDAAALMNHLATKGDDDDDDEDVDGGEDQVDIDNDDDLYLVIYDVKPIKMTFS